MFLNNIISMSIPVKFVINQHTQIRNDMQSFST